uniref:TIAM Rac1 associated GEF 2 n=1 Tax=Electrophorus electricus TaxID=8005 RepID=A0A4W4G711_ELEEL
MGNTDSQQSGLTLPGKPRACSLKLHPSREAVLSPHSWWRSTGGAPGYKARWPSRSGLSQHKSNQPYVSCHYEYISNKQHPGSLRCSERDHEPLTAQGTGCYAGYSRQDEGCGPSPTVQNSSSEPLQNRSSPKVLFSEDGSLRVEFTTGRREMDDQLPLAGRATGTSDSTLRDSKGSSLSSEASWYDSPWGPSMELCDSVFTPGQPSDDSSGYTTLSSTQTEDQKDFELSSVTDLCTHPKLSVPFPTHDIFPAAQDQDIPKPEHLDAPSQEQSPDTWAFSSLTLPCRKSVPDGDTRKGSLKSRIRRLGDWTGSLSRKKRRLQDPSTLEASEAFISGVDGLAGDSVSPWWTLASNQMQSSCSLTDPYAQRGQSATVRQNIYKNFMQELEAGSDGGGVADALQAWEVGGDVGESSSSSLGSLEQMDLLFEKEQGVVRRAGWLAFKPLISLHKDRKLELVARRRWRQYWVTLKGCMLLLSEANSKGCLEQETIPRYALLAEDSIVQAVPEHPKKEYVFCLSNAFGDVYLFQAANQTDVENWVTAIHSACASHVAKRQGREDTVRLLRNQSRALLQKIDMDGKMKKMAELQLSVISDQKNRKAVESQIQQWEQNLEKFNVELFRIRCYLASLQGTETPNPKNLLAVAGRPSKMALSRLGIFSVSSFHALVCGKTLTRRGIFSSQKGLDSLSRHDSEKRQSLSQLAVRFDLLSMWVWMLTFDWLYELAVLLCTGLREGDEILAVNGLSMSTLDLGLMQTSFGQQSLQLVVRREEPDEQSKIWPDCDSSVPYCPLLPLSQSPHTQLVSSGRTSEAVLNTIAQNLHYQLVNISTIVYLDGITADGHDSPYSTDSAPTRRSPRHMSVTERLWKVIQELVDTEKSYVKDLGCLFEIYLKPLERETFLSLGEMESLFGSLPEMLDFQRVFLQTLEERTTSPLDLRTLETPEQLKKMLFSLGGSFLYYADHFKLYSGFCANHIKVQKVLERAKTDRAFKEFLEARNPTKQHSSTLESYLIKPVQRVLKYPLLLRELVSLTDPESEEHSHLTEALRAMEKVASHINEMQKIYEDYGIVFDQLVAEQSSTEKEVTEISIGEFLIHSAALWLNPLPSLGRMRKEPELTLFSDWKIVVCTASRSGDLDPFKFRWLIPSSCLHVRPGNSAGSENPCLWELVHTKSELEGRPETVFQLCSSSLQSKARAVKAIRCLLRENARRNAPPEKAFRGNLTFPRRSHPLAGRSGSWLERLHPQAEAHKGRPLNESGLLGGDTHSEPALPSHPHGAPGDKISNLCKRARLGSLTSSLEAQLQSLTFSEEPPGASWRPSNDLQASQIALLKDSSKVDLSSLLARDYSVQSLSSVVTEDCFYDTVMGIQKATIPTL